MASITGQKRFLEIDTTAETVPGVENGAPTPKYPEMPSAGSAGMREGAQFDNVEIEANRDSQPAPTPSGFMPGGPLMIIPSPYDTARGIGWFRWLLDWTFLRTAGVLDSHTVTEFNPISGTGFGRKWTGCKPDTLGLTWGATNRMSVPTIGVKGMFPTKEGTVPPSPTFPGSRHWTFPYLGVQVSGDLFSGYLGEVDVDRTLRNVSLDASNKIAEGSLSYLYDASGNRIDGVTSLDEGQLEVTGSFEIKMINATEYWDIYRAGTKGQLRLLGFHPDSEMSLVEMSAGFDTSNSDDSGSSTVVVTVADGTKFAVSDCVYIEDSSAADPKDWVREVLYISNIATNDLTLDLDGASSSPTTNTESIGRGQSFTDSSRVYSMGCQLIVREFTITDWEPVGGASETVYQRIPFRAGGFVGAHPSGASFEYPALGYLVH